MNFLFYSTTFWLFGYFCIHSTPILNGDTNQFSVNNCDDIVNVYTQIGYPVIDCLLQNSEPFFPLLFWRVDAKVPYTVALAICRLVEFGDLATVHSSYDQKVLMNLYTGKFILDSWMWIGATRVDGTFVWNDAFDVPLARFYPNSTSGNNGDCLAMIKFGDPEGEDGVAGTFYYSQPCDNSNIAACFTSGSPFLNGLSIKTSK